MQLYVAVLLVDERCYPRYPHLGSIVGSKLCSVTNYPSGVIKLFIDRS